MSANSFHSEVVATSFVWFSPTPRSSLILAARAGMLEFGLRVNQLLLVSVLKRSP